LKLSHILSKILLIVKE